MKRLVLAIAGLTLSAGAMAAGGGALPHQFKADPGNLASAQRGARNYMAYCSGCHSMKLLRYGRIGQDLGISEELLKTNLMFTSEKPGDPIISAMPAQSGEWFGAPPPDLSVKARERGPAWIYNYLMTFYADSSRPLGVNNLVLPGASMPHVLGDLQGWQVKEEVPHAEGETTHAPKNGGLTLAKPGKLSPDEYSRFVTDITHFMMYAAEPGRAHRVSTGVNVLLFLFVFTILAYLMKREWWKDVH